LKSDQRRLRKTAQTNKQTDRQTNRHYENNGHLAVNQLCMTWLEEKISVTNGQYMIDFTNIICGIGSGSYEQVIESYNTLANSMIN